MKRLGTLDVIVVTGRVACWQASAEISEAFPQTHVSRDGRILFLQRVEADLEGALASGIDPVRAESVRLTQRRWPLAGVVINGAVTVPVFALEAYTPAAKHAALECAIALIER